MTSPYINIAIEAARAAGKQIRKASERIDLIKISHKGYNDIVTDVDHKSEREIVKTILKAYPHHAILSEEAGLIQPESPMVRDESAKSVSRFVENAPSDFIWIIDPIDGTTNFAHGYPHYCVSIALEIKGKLEHAVVYDPVRDELFTASAGKGAQLNGRRIRCAATPQLEGAFLGASHGFKNPQDIPKLLSKMASLLPIASGVRRAGSAVLDLAYVATGRLDACCAMQLKPWDMAAGVLLALEAGALVSDFQGTENFWQSGNIVMANAKLFKQLLKVMSK